MALDLGVVWHAVESVMSFFIIGCIGYCLARRGWFSNESTTLITRLITLVALPIYLLYNINNSLDKDQLFKLIYGTLLPLTSILAMLGLGFLVRRLIRVPPGRRGIFTASFAFSNSIFIGLPVNMALFGEEALPYVLLYYFASTSLFWSVGNYLIASDGQTTPSPIVSLDTLKKIVSPPMLGFLSGLFLVLLGVKLPGVLANTARFMGGMTTPLVLLALGVMICDMGLSKIRFTRELFLVMVARFVVAPLLIILLTGLVPVDSLMRRVFIIQASLPVISSLALLAKFYNSDYDTATINVSATTMMSLVTVPVFMVIGSSI